MSFFNDDEGPHAPSSTRAPTRPQRPRPRPRRPTPGGAGAGRGSPEHRAVMMRRRIAAAVGVVLVIVIVIIASSIIHSQKVSALQSYGTNVNQLARESGGQLSKGLFSSLLRAGSKGPVEVQQQINQLHSQAALLAERASAMSVPGEVAQAQRSVVLALNLRSEALAKIAGLVRMVLGGTSATHASRLLAGDMEMFLASDVIWSQRVVPLVSQTLSAAGLTWSSASSRFLPNLGWLEPETAQARIVGQGGSEAGSIAPGTHGDALAGVSVGTSALQAEPALNHLTAGTNPTFTVSVKDTGENRETNVKVEVAALVGGKRLAASHSIETIEPGQTVSVDIPISGVPLGTTAQVEASVGKVPGEENVENNKAVYQAIFE